MPENKLKPSEWIKMRYNQLTCSNCEIPPDYVTQAILNYLDMKEGGVCKNCGNIEVNAKGNLVKKEAPCNGDCLKEGGKDE